MNNLVADAATAVALGRRQRQEDAVVTNFSQGGEVGLAVLSDGMGGHSAGDVASRVIVSEIFSQLFFCGSTADHLRQRGAQIMRNAVASANRAVLAHAEAGSGRDGMGGTVVATVLVDDKLRWVSVGDSPLYLYRDGALCQLNEDHSMAPQIDHMAREGIIDEDVARNHPQRHCLTSALTGGEIGKVDCPEEAFALQDEDIVLIASDGLQALPDAGIERVVSFNRHKDSQGIAAALLDAVSAIDSPNQDNVSLAVIKLDKPTGKKQSTPYLEGLVSGLVEGGRKMMAPMRQLSRPGKGRSVL